MSLIARIRSLFAAPFPTYSFERGQKRTRRGPKSLYLEALEGRQLFSSSPILTTFTVSLSHDKTKTFATSQFADSSHDTLSTITIESLPTSGNLTLNGTAVTAGQVLTAASISTLVYTPAAHYFGPDSFTWNASDGVHAYGNATVNLNVAETAPALTTLSLTTSHSNPITFSSSKFSADFIDAEGDALSSITLVSLPTHGTLLLNGSAVQVNTVITAANIGSLTYTPTPSYKGADTFLWNATDGLMNAPQNAAVNITVQETAPTVRPFLSVPGENEAVSFLNGNSNLFALTFSDVDAGDSLQAIKIISTPAHGNLTLTSGNTSTPVTGNQVIAASDIENLVYTPANGFVGCDTFKWTASDGTLFATTSTTATLDVRYFTVVANNNVLSKGDNSPSAAKFTDFGFASTDLTSPSLTRTFTINDVGALDLNFTGTPIVQITGSNFADFTVSTQPTGNLTSGQSTTFTITFTPHGTGTRNATVSIANSIPGQSPFTFAIRGTGLATGTTSDGLILGQIKNGSGNRAASLDAMAVNYTGTFLSGMVFSTNLTAGGTPLQFTLGEGQVIPGWDEGLVGIKPGETRLFIVPSALAYGPGGSPSTNGSVAIPPDTTLEFTVTCLGIAKAKLLLAGNNTLMAAGNMSVSTLNGTQFGILPTGNTSLARTFIITDGGGGVLGFPNSGPAVTVTGANASDFFASTIGFASDGSSANFTVTFQPTAGGTRNAIVHVHTNDPDHPDFTFAVQGTILFTDLAASLGTIALPTPPTIVGGNTTLSVPVVVSNIGGLKVPSSTPNATITVLIHDNVNNFDLPLQTFTNQNVSGLGLNQTKVFNEKITIPSGFDVDNATITATIAPDALHPIVETNPLAPSVVTTNNTVTATLSSDLVGTLVSTSLLPQIVTGAKQSGNVTIALKNLGNLTLPSSQKVNLTATAVEQTSGAIIPLGSLLNQSIGSLAGNATKNFAITVPSGTTFPDGTYIIHVLITPVAPIPGELASDNDVSLTAASAALTVTASAPFDNINGTLISSTLPTSGGNTGPITGNVSVLVKNAANRALPSNEKVTIEIIAHDLDESVPDTVLTTSVPQSISGWAANKSQTFTVPVTYTSGLLIDHYQIEALLVPTNATTIINESSVDDNLLTAKADNSTITYNSQTPVNDFVVNTVTSTIASKPATQPLKGNVTVRIQNAGNIPMPSLQHVTIQIVAHLSTANAADHSGDILLNPLSTPQSIANLAPGAALSFSMPVNFAPGLASGAYQIEALIVPVETLSPAEANVLDNYGAVTVANNPIMLAIT